MSSKLLFLIGLVVVLAIYGTALVVLLGTPGNNSIPTPGHAVVAAIIAMFSTLLVFVFGFIRAATVSQD